MCCVCVLCVKVGDIYIYVYLSDCANIAISIYHHIYIPLYTYIPIYLYLYPCTLHIPYAPTPIHTYTPIYTFPPHTHLYDIQWIDLPSPELISNILLVQLSVCFVAPLSALTDSYGVFERQFVTRTISRKSLLLFSCCLVGVVVVVQTIYYCLLLDYTTVALCYILYVIY